MASNPADLIMDSGKSVSSVFMGNYGVSRDQTILEHLWIVTWRWCFVDETDIEQQNPGLVPIEIEIKILMR